MKYNWRLYGKWLLFGSCICMFLLFAHQIGSKDPLWFDEYIYQALTTIMNERVTNVFKLLTRFGNLEAFVIIGLITFYLVHSRRNRLLIVANLGIVFGCNVLLKMAFSRPRPLDIALIKESGFSFPSGHAMVSVAFYGFLIYLIFQSQQSKWRKIGVSIVLGCIIIGVGISRIYLGVHYASDVIAGASLSLAYVILLTTFARKYDNKKGKQDVR
ncbi:MAG: phosphatase PAP2 family protein [Bacilli bacterium]|nr:phosphatase PAP2 family protein [Bacilli bacterium]